MPAGGDRVRQESVAALGDAEHHDAVVWLHPVEAGAFPVEPEERAWRGFDVPLPALGGDDHQPVRLDGADDTGQAPLLTRAGRLGGQRPWAGWADDARRRGAAPRIGRPGQRGSAGLALLVGADGGGRHEDTGRAKSGRQVKRKTPRPGHASPT